MNHKTPHLLKMHEMQYEGNELVLFQHASVWKNYFGSILQPYLGKNVLEVGAGLGSTTKIICNGTQHQWLCLEPDPNLFASLLQKIQNSMLPPCCVAIQGTIQDLPLSKKFNSILYIDVIEHIQDDAAELHRAVDLLSDDGYLIVLVPAHYFLWSPFDKAIGHYRRYNKKMLKAVVPKGMELVSQQYLDAMGLMAAVTNRIFLKQRYPTIQQISFWDRVLVRFSKPIDFVTGYHVGKTLLGVWKKTNADQQINMQ